MHLPCNPHPLFPSDLLLGWVNEECAAYVGAVRGVPRADGDDDDAVIQVVLVTGRGDLQVKPSNGGREGYDHGLGQNFKWERKCLRSLLGSCGKEAPPPPDMEGLG